MKSPTILLAGLAATVGSVSAAGVTGSAEGFAKGVTGGGSAKPVYPTTNDELVSYLGDSTARVIMISKTFDFTGTEGTATATGCAPWGTASGCQKAINQNDWCTNYEPDAPRVSVTYDKAGILGITVGSDKSIVGVGSAGIIKGKGLRIVGGSNVIIQNIEITGLNPQYVWGGDAITIDGGDLIWIDHVTTSLIGRQHIVLGTGASNRVTISNCYINGATSWSATCDGHHYWNVYLDGSNDLVTMKNNYFSYTSGRAPKVAGNTLLHAVNNYWYQNSGHAFEVDSGGMVVVEGSVFQNVNAMVETSSLAGHFFTSPSTSSNAACARYLGHNCQLNAFSSSTASYAGTDTSFFSDFSGKNIASADTAATCQANVSHNAGMGKL